MVQNTSQTQQSSAKQRYDAVLQAREAERQKNLRCGLGCAKRAQIRKVETRAGTVRVLEYGFDTEAPQPLMVDLHGGGFLFNTADVDEPMLLRMQAKVPGCKWISIDYPKAPEQPFPAAPNAIFDTVLFYVQHAQTLGVDENRMVIGGHSAGGNLSTVMCMRAAQTGAFSFCGQVLDYPPLDLATPAAHKPNPDGCIPADLAELFNACYLNGQDARNPEISPVFARPEIMRRLPPALMLVCGKDSLRDEGVRYAEMLRQAGVSVTLREYAGQLHGFTYDATPEALQAVDGMAAFFARCVAVKSTAAPEAE